MGFESFSQIGHFQRGFAKSFAGEERHESLLRFVETFEVGGSRLHLPL